MTKDGKRGKRGSRHRRGSAAVSQLPASQQYTSSEAFENDYLLGFDRHRDRGGDNGTPGVSPGTPQELHGSSHPTVDPKMTVDKLATRMLNLKMNACLNSWREYTEVGPTHAHAHAHAHAHTEPPASMHWPSCLCLSTSLWENLVGKPRILTVDGWCVPEYRRAYT